MCIVTSAMRGQRDSLLEVSGACKMPANRGISGLMYFPTFHDIRSGCCTDVRACIRKVRDDRYSASCLEASYASFVLGIFCELLRLDGVLRSSPKICKKYCI